MATEELESPRDYIPTRVYIVVSGSQGQLTGVVQPGLPRTPQHNLRVSDISSLPAHSHQRPGLCSVALLEFPKHTILLTPVCL